MIDVILHQRWFRPAFVGLVLLFCAALGLVTDITALVAVVVAAVAFGFMVLLSRNLWFGLVLVIVAAMFLPFGLGTGTQSSINLAMLILMGTLGLWFAKMFIEHRTIRLVPSAPVAPIILLAVTAFVSFLVGQLNWFPIEKASIASQMGGLMLFFLATGAFLVAANVVKETRRLAIMVWVFIALCGVLIAGILVPPLGNMLRRLYDSRAFGSVFWVWLFTMVTSQLLFNAHLKMPVRAALGVLLLGASYVAFVYNITWTSGWLPPVVGVLALMVASKSRLLYVMLFFGIIVAVAQFDRIYDVLMAGDNVYSLDTRLAAWGILGEILKVNAIFGLGPSNYYWYTPLFSIMGYYVPFNSHNNYVDIVAQTGLLGMFFYLLFWWKLGWLGMNMRARVPEGFPTAYVLGAIGGTAGMIVSGMFGDWVIPFVYNVGLSGFRASLIGWLFLGGLVALEQIYPKKSEL